MEEASDAAVQAAAAAAAVKQQELRGQVITPQQRDQALLGAAAAAAAQASAATLATLSHAQQRATQAQQPFYPPGYFPPGISSYTELLLCDWSLDFFTNSDQCDPDYTWAAAAPAPPRTTLGTYQDNDYNVEEIDFD